MSMMIFMILCFVGLFLMFLCILRSQDKLLKAVRADLAESQAQVQALEQRFDSLIEALSPVLELPEPVVVLEDPNQGEQGQKTGIDLELSI